MLAQALCGTAMLAWGVHVVLRGVVGESLWVVDEAAEDAILARQDPTQNAKSSRYRSPDLGPPGMDLGKKEFWSILSRKATNTTGH